MELFLWRVDEAAGPAVVRPDGGVEDTLLGRFDRITIITILRVLVAVVIVILLLLLLDHRLDHRCRMVHPTRRSCVSDVTHLLLAMPLILAARSPGERPLEHPAAVAVVAVATCHTVDVRTVEDVVVILLLHTDSILVIVMNHIRHLQTSNRMDHLRDEDFLLHTGDLTDDHTRLLLLLLPFPMARSSGKIPSHTLLHPLPPRRQQSKNPLATVLETRPWHRHVGRRWWSPRRESRKIKLGRNLPLNRSHPMVMLE